jgi:D-cysteine desulfhydrase family pyridoxal phosphate-dependent enzyme
MSSDYSIAEIKKRIAQFPKKSIIYLPTPFTKLENLSAELGGPEIYIKRDDLTGLAFGGNKSRKLEFIIQDALKKKSEVIITWASLQSNWCLQTASAARRFGLKPILILFKTYDLPPGLDGNMLLDYIVGADIRIRDAEKGKVVTAEYAADVVEEVVNEVKEWGHKPYVAPLGGSSPGGDMKEPLGAISYVAAFVEMLEQANERGVGVTHIVHSTGSGGTQAGLAVGAKAVKKDCRVIGISVSDEKEIFGREVLTVAQQTERALKLDLGMERGDIIVFDEYLQEGYGIVTKEVAEALRLVFQKEGIVLDPVYTGKAMVGLIDLVGRGFFSKKDKVVFFHTGGTPALFPNRDKLVDFLK